MAPADLALLAVQADYAEQPHFTEWASPSAQRQELEYLEARGPGGIGSAGQSGRQTSLDFQQQQQQSRLNSRRQPDGEDRFQQQQDRQPDRQPRQLPQRPLGQQLQQPGMNQNQSSSSHDQGPEQDEEADLEERVARIFRQR